MNKVNKPEDLISESEKTALVEAILARQESKKEKKKAQKEFDEVFKQNEES